MRVLKAVLTAAGRAQRHLPLQSLIDQDGVEKPVLRILLEEVLRGGVEEIAVVVAPGDEAAYARLAGDHAGRIRFVEQREPRGYGHAVWCARDFVGDEPFLHLVSDHLAVSRAAKSCAEQLVAVAAVEECAVSAVQTTRESLIGAYGVVGGRRLAGREDLYRIERVIEKPTPTEAEQQLHVPGLRAGHYLAFFGMHVLTPLVIELLGRAVAAAGAEQSISLSEALDELARREHYLAFEVAGWRYDLGARYGLLTAQMALALAGKDRDEVLTRLVELLALRATGRPGVA